MNDIIQIDSTWVRDRFNFQYNNIFSNQAPGMEDYDITMALNMAHIEILDEYSNGIDLFEKNRSILNGYIIEDNIDGELSTSKLFGIDYQTFSLSDNYWKILIESITTNAISDEAVVKPIKYDELSKYSKNPYRKPNGLRAWRLDVNSNPSEDSVRDVKILFKKMSSTDYIKKYNVVYFAIPDRFDLESDVIPKTLETNLFLTEKVINRACELATRDYKSNTLESQIQTNARSR